MLKTIVSTELKKEFKTKKYNEIIETFLRNVFNNPIFKSKMPFIVESVGKRMRTETKSKTKKQLIKEVQDKIVELMIKNQPQTIGIFKLGEECYDIEKDNIQGRIEFIDENGFVYFVTNEKSYIVHNTMLRKEFPSVSKQIFFKTGNFLARFGKITLTTEVRYIMDDVNRNKFDFNPFYQRGLIWDEKQKREYIEALFLKKATIHFSLIYNNYEEMVKSGFEGEILDGKQRLSTVVDFVKGKFPIFGDVKFENLSKEDKLFFLNQDIKYDRYEKKGDEKIKDEEKVQLFLELNAFNTLQDRGLIDDLKERFLK